MRKDSGVTDAGNPHQCGTILRRFEVDQMRSVMMPLERVITGGANAKFESNKNSSQMHRKWLKRTAFGNRRHKTTHQKHMQRHPRIKDLQEKSNGKQNEDENKR